MMWSDIQHLLSLSLYACLIDTNTCTQKANICETGRADYLIWKSKSSERRIRRINGFELETSQTQTQTSWPGLHHLFIDILFISYSGHCWPKEVNIQQKTSKGKSFTPPQKGRKNLHLISFTSSSRSHSPKRTGFQTKKPLQNITQSENAYFQYVFINKNANEDGLKEEVLNNKSVCEERLPFQRLESESGKSRATSVTG